ncbi:MAG TPA: hypothetical protein VH331_18760 [Allosphingosinicella sp.]|jgi:hypothetical protein|nr:hypothetical protein [Allosphingosinicella sp.]
MKTLYQHTPPLIVTILVFALLISLLVAGAYLRRLKDHIGGSNEDEDEGAIEDEPDKDQTFENLIASAVLGLLALLLGFSFAVALDRFDVRRSMTLQEANAIGTTYLRSQLMDEPYRTRFRHLLEGYTLHRIETARASDADVRRGLSAKTQLYRRQIAETTLEAIRPFYNSEFGTSFMESVNETLNIGAARKAARLATIPTRVLSMLLLYMAVTSMIVGFVKDPGKNRWGASVLLFMLAMSYGLILDIDQPNRGAIQESQAPMEDVLRTMQIG